MTTYISALDTIATFAGTVSGVANAYTLAQTPTQIVRDILPCAIMLPLADGSLMFRSQSMMGGAPYIEFDATQLVLWSFAVSDYDTSTAAIHQFISDYITALAALPFYAAATAPAVHSMPTVDMKHERINYGGVDLWGVSIRHQNLRINL